MNMVLEEKKKKKKNLKRNKFKETIKSNASFF